MAIGSLVFAVVIGAAGGVAEATVSHHPHLSPKIWADEQALRAAYKSGNKQSIAVAQAKLHADIAAGYKPTTTTAKVTVTTTTVRPAGSTTTTAKPTTPTTAKAATTTTVKATTTTTVASTPTASVGDVNAIQKDAAAGSTLSLGSGTYTFSDFANSNAGVDLKTDSIKGAGSAKTTVEMKANSSTKAGSVPTASGTTNQLYLMRTMSGSPTLSGFTLLGTDQGHLYNGLMIGRTTGAKITDVKVVGAPGNASAPPGETFGINDYDTTNSVYTNVEVDGQGKGAAAFGTNGSKNVTINGLYSHDSPYSAGITYWKTDGGTLTDFRSVNNKKAINFEQDTGTFNIIRPTFTNSLEGFDLSTFSNLGPITVNISDPILAPGQKIKIRAYVGVTDYGGVNKEQKSDIKVTVNGVDETSSLVSWQ